MSTELNSNQHQKTPPSRPGEQPVNRATGGETEALPDKETRGILPGDALCREAGPEGFVIPPAKQGKTEGAPSGGTAGGAPATEQNS